MNDFVAQSLAFAVGDRVRVIAGKHIGAIGVVELIDRGAIVVCSERTGYSVPFNANELEKVAPLLDEIPDSAEVWGDSLHDYDDDSNPSTRAALQELRSRLAATALSGCWLESAGGDRMRLTYYRSLKKPARYIEPKQAAEYSDRIAAGRALKHCDALLQYLGNLNE